ncbi:MAG: SH3 domain-containing protein, partial [Bacillota bacterium]
MATRLAVLAAAFSVVIAAPLMPASTYAQERTEDVPQVENSRYQFAGVINTNAVQVRSGPSENYYATMRLDKGTPVTVVGIKLDWLKITPPEGSYSLISKAFVQRQGDSNAGTVIRNSIRVRAGSTMTPLKTAVQCKLSTGTQVTIVGEQDEYYQIKPPADAFLYVHQKYVDPVKQLNEKPLAVSSKTSGKPHNDTAIAVGPDKAPTTQMATNTDTNTQENSTSVRT